MFCTKLVNCLSFSVLTLKFWVLKAFVNSKIKQSLSYNLLKLIKHKHTKLLQLHINIINSIFPENCTKQQTLLVYWTFLLQSLVNPVFREHPCAIVDFISFHLASATQRMSVLSFNYFRVLGSVQLVSSLVHERNAERLGLLQLCYKKRIFVQIPGFYSFFKLLLISCYYL